MPDEFVWTFEDEANYFRQSYLDLKAHQERTYAAALLLIDFISRNEHFIPEPEKAKLMQDLWNLENGKKQPL